MKYYRKIFFCLFIVAHFSCKKEKTSLYGLWENNNKDTYNFMNEKILVKTLNSDNSIKIKGNWELKKENIFLNDTLNISVNYKKIILNDTLIRNINTNKILVIYFYKKKEFKILNENGTKYKKIIP